MKKIYKLMFVCGFLLLINQAQAQVAIGKSVVEPSVLLDFNAESKGIILPVVSSLPDSPKNGTFVMDGRASQLKVLAFENDVWKELSDVGSISREGNTGNETTTAVILNSSAEVGSGVVISDNSASILNMTNFGVLVLDSSDKAMVLPKVNNPHLTIKSPRAGTICYDTESDSLAVFDGKVWNYWK